MYIKYHFLFLLIAATFIGCKKKEIRFAVSAQDENYKEYAYALEKVFDEENIRIEVIETC